MNEKLIGWNSEVISDTTSLCTTPDYDIIRWWRSRFKGILQLEWLCVFLQVTEKIQLERESRQSLLFSLWQPEQTDLTPNSLIRAVELSRRHQSSYLFADGFQNLCLPSQSDKKWPSWAVWPPITDPKHGWLGDQDANNSKTHWKTTHKLQFPLTQWLEQIYSKYH